MSLVTSLVPSRVEAFYAFMTERENIRLRRLLGWEQTEWTYDSIFKQYSFTNVKREHDRTTVLLLKEMYSIWHSHMESDYGAQWWLRRSDYCEDDLENLLLNCAIFRYFGCIETAETIGWSDDWSDETKFRIKYLGECNDLKFTSAYIVPNCGRSESKYVVVLDIIDGISKRLHDIVNCTSWQKQCEILSSCYGCGSFMAKEILLDYILVSKQVPSDWTTWTPVGPGGRRGAGRVYTGRKVALGEELALDVIRLIYDVRKEYWRDDFVSLDLTDIQFQLCEFDKYSRVAEGRTPKRKFKPKIDEITQRMVPLSDYDDEPYGGGV